MNAPTRNDMLASNLLYAALGLPILFQVASWISQALALPHSYFSPVQFNLPILDELGLFMLVRGGLAYAVRRGALAAKLLVALGIVGTLYLWDNHLLVGVNDEYFGVASLVLLLTNLLTLAALVAMVWPNRESAPIV